MRVVSTYCILECFNVLFHTRQRQLYVYQLIAQHNFSPELKAALRKDPVVKCKLKLILSYSTIYRKVASSNMSPLEAHAGFFRLVMKGIFDPYVL